MMERSVLALAAVLSVASANVAAQSTVGPVKGEREFSLAGTGSSDKDFDNSAFGLSADLAWYTSSRTAFGVRQSINFADIKGRDFDDDFWNGSTRGYVNYHFGAGNARPFLGASLGVVYGDGVSDSGFAGLEFGLKYYVLEKTYILGRAEYQFFFDSGSSAEDNFDDGAFVYTFGMGFNF